MWKEQTGKPHPNHKPLEKLRIVDGGPFFSHDPLAFPTRGRAYTIASSIALAPFFINMTSKQTNMELLSNIQRRYKYPDDY